MPTLVFETGPKKGTTVPLGPGSDLLVGRDAECDVRLDDTQASARHCKLKEHKGRYYVKDLHSEHGTRVNDAVIDQGEIKPGDRLRVGETVLSLLADGAESSLVGKEIAGYRLLERIGQGGMGAVFRALQISLHREVALKVLKPSLTKDAQFIEQFMREARAAGALNHANICQVYDVGQAGNLYYYSMEYIPNGSVEDLLNQTGGALPIDEAVRIVVEAARALQYAELKHIVHRDIKPANLMLTELKHVKIADLGLARSLRESAEKEPTGTLGTPHFISPEQAMRREVDIRSDIYSLGATFYRLLTGKTLFEGDSAQEILRKQVKEQPKPVRELRADVPERVERVLNRMLQKEPSARQASAAELVTELEALTHKKHSRVLLVGALLVALIAIAGATWFYIQSQKQPTVKIVEKQTTDPNEQKRLHETMSEKERLERELKARDARDQLAASLTPPERAAGLRQLAQTYAGTKVAEDADKEAGAIEEGLRREQQEREQKQAQLTAKIDQAKSQVGAALQARDFAAARAAAVALGAGGEPEATQARDELFGTIDAVVKKARDQTMTEAEAKLSSGDVRGGLEQLDQMIAVLGPAAEKMPGDAFPALASAVDDLKARRASAVESDASARAEQSRADLKRTAQLLSDRGIRDQLLALQLDDVLARVQAAEAEIRTEDHRQRLAQFRREVEGLKQLLDKLRATVEAGTLQDGTIREQPTSEEGKIVGFVEPAGLRAEYPRAGGRTTSTLRFQQFASGAGLLELLCDRWDQSPDEIEAIGRAAVLLAAARAAEKLGPLEDAVAAYTPDAGWAAARSKIEGLSLNEMTPPELGPIVKRLAKTDGERAARFEAWAENERAAFTEAKNGLAPFLSERPGFTEAAQTLKDLVAKRAGTNVVGFLYALLDGGRYEVPLTAPP